MKAAIKYITMCVLIACCSHCSAQGYTELLQVSDDFIPLKVQNSVIDKGFYANDFKVNDFLPVFLNKDRSQYVIVGLNFQSIGFAGTHPDFPVRDLYGIAPVMGYGRQINKRLMLSALFIPLLNSDLVAITGSDLHLGGVVRGNYQINDHFSIRLSLGCRMQYYGPQYIVLTGFDWQITERWRLFADAPTYGTLSYNISQKVNAGISYIAGNTSYGVSALDHYLQYTFTQPGIFAEYYITSMLAVRGTIAYSVQRGMDIYTMNEKVQGGVMDYINLGPQAIPLNREVTNGPAFKLSLSLRAPDRVSK